MGVPLPRLAVIATTLTASLLAAVSPASASPSAPTTSHVRAGTATGWPQLQGNAAHTGFESGETSVTSSNVNQLSVAWTAPLPSPSGTPDLTVAGGTVYAASGSTVTALNAVTGAQLWQVSRPGRIASTPAVQGSLVITGYDRGRGSFSRVVIVALNSATGAVVWTHRVSGHQLEASVTTTPRRVYLSITGGQVLALGIAHGHQVWASPTLAGASCDISAPSVGGGFVVVGGGGTSVSALHASDGTLAWQDTLSSGCGFSSDNWVPAISGTKVYAGLLNGVAALDLASGTVRWTNPSAGMVFFPLSVTGSTVIAGANDDTEPIALARSDGTLQWSSPFQPPPLVVGGLATFGSLTWATVEPTSDFQAQAVAFDTATGQKVFSSALYPDPTTDFPPPIVAAGRVYLNLTNEVLCLALPPT